MAYNPPEPKRNSDLASLEPYVAARVEAVLEDMQAAGYDPVVFEARRSETRQRWLYGVGRTHRLNRKPVTWTMQSKHIVGKAADIISSSRGWNWPKFFTELRLCAEIHGLHTLQQEACHLEWRG